MQFYCSKKLTKLKTSNASVYYKDSWNFPALAMTLLLAANGCNTHIYNKFRNSNTSFSISSVSPELQLLNDYTTINFSWFSSSEIIELQYFDLHKEVCEVGEGNEDLYMDLLHLSIRKFGYASEIGNVCKNSCIHLYGEKIDKKHQRWKVDYLHFHANPFFS